MKSSEIRTSFLEYFRSKGHEIVPSSPLVPDDADKETELYDLLRERNGLSDFRDFRSYVRWTVGSEAHQFLTDVFRFRADGQNERGLSVLQIGNGTSTVISAAPKSFGASGT